FSKSGGSNGIGFAIPSSLALKVMRNLIEDGRVIRGWLGVETQELTPQLAESFGLNNVKGLILAGVITNGPAYNAGLRVGDLILAFNDISIISGLDSMRSIAEEKPGSIIKVNFLRNGKSLTTNILVAERPSS
ncbi:MAG: PDZ domain-containing protein, partial [Oceanospirillaceae bacterium]|nr:PDZ domain-containing protein [Oceanospirillaceae bacterium]